MKLLSTNRRVLRGPDALWVYRTLTEVHPAAYGSKLAHVLVEAARSPHLDALPAVRRALLTEALGVAQALDTANPFREKVLAAALAALGQESAVS